MWGDPSDFNSENNSIGSGSDDIHVRNKVTLKNEKWVFFRSHM